MPSLETNVLKWLAERALKPETAGVVKRGIGDDMAIVRAGGADVLITTDMLLDGVHFDLAAHGFRAVGRKALACSLSDCAAMAVRPLAATVSVALPAATRFEDVTDFYHGLRELADEFNTALVGGDTTVWDRPFAVDVCVLAVPHAGIDPIGRDGARVGDALYVTGPLGGSLLGHHLTFTPRVAEAERIARAWGGAVHALMDISDGLSLDLWRMCQASSVGAVLDESLLEAVTSADARQAAATDGRTPLHHALTDGEDFELLFAADDAASTQSVNVVTLHRVGTVTERDLLLRGVDGRLQPLPPEGYEHGPC